MIMIKEYNTEIQKVRLEANPNVPMNDASFVNDLVWSMDKNSTILGDSPSMSLIVLLALVHTKTMRMRQLTTKKRTKCEPTFTLELDII